MAEVNTRHSRELIRPAEYARRRGKTPAAVSKAIKRCGIPLVNGRLDPLVADVLWRARTDPLQAARANGQNKHLRDDQPEGVGDNWHSRLIAAQALRAELELRKAAGELVECAAVERLVGRRLDAQRQRLEALPDRAAAELGISDEHRRKVRQFLRDEIAQICIAVIAIGQAEPA